MRARTLSWTVTNGIRAKTLGDVPARRLSPEGGWTPVPARRLSPEEGWTPVPARRLSPEGGWTRDGVPARTLGLEGSGL